MNNKIINVLVFAAGAAIGSAVTWKLMKNKYEGYEEYTPEQTEEVVEEVPEEEPVEEEEEVMESPATKYEKPSIFDYAAKLEEQGYTNYSTVEKKEEAPSVEPVDYEKPYIIELDEFGDYDDYNMLYLTYFAGDKVLADNYGEIVDDIDDVVGLGAIEELNTYSEEVLYVRNDRLTCDYEITLDEGKYSDVYGR